MKKSKIFTLLVPILLSFSTFSCGGNASKGDSGDTPSGGETTLHSLYIASLPITTLYNVGDSFSLNGIKVIDTTDGSIVSGYTSSIVEGYKFTSEDVSTNTSVTISKEGYNSTYFSIAISNYEKLVIVGEPVTTFIVGDLFVLGNITVTTESGVVVNDYTSNIRVGNALNTVGQFEVVLSKTGFASVSYTINVNPIRSLQVDSLPTVTSYTVGDAFSSSGLVIVDELNNVVTDYSLDIEEGTIFKYDGDFTVTVSKEEYISTSFTVTVSKHGGGEEINRTLSFYYLNDTHGSFIRNESLNEAGMSYLSSYIKTNVNNDPNNSIVLSGGDMFQGGYESNETKGKIMVEAMNEIGFDAMVLGNHEFDWGEEAIETNSQLLDCPLISCNVFYSYDKTTRPDWVTPYAIIERGDLKVGIIGADEEDIGTSITGSISDNFYFPSPVSYIKQYSTYLRTNAGCDVIIAAFHDGGFEGYDGEPVKYQELTTTDSTTNRKYVDAMFFAHDHMRKNGTYNGVPFLEAGCNGKNIGVLSLDLLGDGYSYEVTDSSTHVYWGTTVAKTQDPKIEAIAQKDEYREIIEHADDVIYTFDNRIESDDFAYSVCKAMYWFVNNNLELFDNTQIYFASHNKGGIRSDVEAGDFTRRDLIKVFPFDNLLSMQTCTSNNINRMSSSSYYRTYDNGNIVYTGGYTKAISITYITEYRYAYYYQVDYKNYEYTAKDALLNYLLAGAPLGL